MRPAVDDGPAHSCRSHTAVVDWWQYLPNGYSRRRTLTRATSFSPASGKRGVRASDTDTLLPKEIHVTFASENRNR